MDWIEVLGYVASGAVFVTFWMKTLISLRLVAIMGNVLYLSYGLTNDIGNIILLHGSLLPVNCWRLYESVMLRRKLHRMARDTFDPRKLLEFMVRIGKGKGAQLFRQGDPATEIYYLLEGRLRIEELGLELEAGRMVGEIAMFTETKSRTQTITCIEDCVLMQMSEEKALQLYAENPEFGLYVTKMMVDRLLSNAHGLEQLKAS